MTRLCSALACLALGLWVNAAQAQQAMTGAELRCDSASIFSGRLITDICWDCIFPIRIAGSAFGTSPGGGGVPGRANSDPFCLCRDPLGVPHPGVTISLWEPARLYEIVRHPGCSPAMGTTFPIGNRARVGTRGMDGYANDDLAWLHYHVWSFPILLILELFTVDRCLQDGWFDIDMMYMSELDPTWTYDAISVWATPEAALTANPVAQASCPVDAVAANAGFPLDPIFWCAGSWGALYPQSGTVSGAITPQMTSSLLVARAIAAQHRRGLAWRTMGSDTLCKGQIDPFIPKSQYRLSWLHPVPESRSAHPIGRDPLAWGSFRNLPGQSDNIQLGWRWNDCCSARR